ncbi:uncharacterized protein Z520_06068 [Fonsecaea multimorphosa CBS 102226]|uniref:Uncharacterized protein n=1 Tax=Fonsecaea multimorphosa CBS 102226 TaxID=1442371 RepID=A0A0D2K490_9EURO|nr:uncharacterized protein Z520_06068 [Fonsecaea multimorphosa CBS 102226]KIX97989.1 hypothetical protein Z520_06068 [Fonsecaea multimorphosa CBS 102226]OAL24358.1 hypothetical protein AYO22_05734 [Fonsecaea multimorphosa]
MASQTVLNGVNGHSSSSVLPAVPLPSSFTIQPQDERLKRCSFKTVSSPAQAGAAPSTTIPPLSVLSNFAGTFHGTGFNTIFRPNSGVTGDNTTFPNAVTPAPPAVPNDNTLELNLTQETLQFHQPLGNVPNRGFGTQGDIFLNGVPYTQIINDVVNPATGKGDGVPSGIHFEPGLWMHVPATTSDPVVPESLNRMGSIPHGTTINAQCLDPTSTVGTVAGPPTIPAVDITPTIIATGKTATFPSQTATNTDTARLPQDLTKFIAAGTITQAILSDPATVLRNAIVGQTITQTIFFTVSTTPATPELGGGVANTGFLIGATAGTTGTGTGTAQTGPNAQATTMTATFWIETVQYELQIPAWKPGHPAMLIQAPVPQGNTSGVPTPTFLVQPPHEITSPVTITVQATQIQYSQLVNLVFAGLIWPHSSHATLVPQAPVPVPASAFGNISNKIAANGS